MNRRRRRVTVHYKPTGAGKTMMRAMGVFHAVFGTVFAIIAVTVIIPSAGLFGVLFLAAGVFFAVNGTLIALGKEGLMGRSYQVETETDEDGELTDEDAPESSAVSVPPPATPQPSVEARLRQLEDLREKRLITANEFEEKRKEILKEL